MPKATGNPQNDRLLRLLTPLDKQYGVDALIPESLEGSECISSQAGVTGFRFVVTALSRQDNIPLTPALGMPALLGLLTAHSRSQLRPFHGHITCFERLSADGGLTRYRLTIEPWLAFCAYRRDSALFQDQTVLDILNSVLARSAGEGCYSPDWRFDLADPGVYKPRSLTCQYQETDLDFIHRLMAEEGLYYWFSHNADASSPQLGHHTLVIADHNTAFTANAQASIRYTQSGSVFPEDSIDRWQETQRLSSHEVQTASWDYRAHQVRVASNEDASPSARTAQDNLGLSLSRHDSPGQYAYGSSHEGQRLAAIALDSLHCQRHQAWAEGTVRTAAPGTRFTLTGHPGNPDPDASQPSEYLITAVSHSVHNNLPAHLRSLAADDPGTGRYRNRLAIIPSATTYRSQTQDQHGLKLHPKPTVHGQHTAIVVGDGQPVHTDRDHRIKIQFHWQRGDSSQNRLEHPYPDGHRNAPGTGQNGTWVRVLANLAPIASDNWGSVNLPRVGQEVLVDFLEGDIDRPVVIACLYNGQGQANAAHNQVHNTAPAATANAPAWFAGSEGSHNHPASLSGLKSQQLGHSQDGQGGYNQLVFDDSPGQSRASLQQHNQAHHGDSELNLGKLHHQSDNQRQHPTGHGLELKTTGSAALRAGQGLLLSSHSQATNAMHMDSTAAINLLDSHYQLNLSLADAAYRHHPKTGQANTQQPQADKLPAISQLKHSADTLSPHLQGSDGTTDGQSQGNQQIHPTVHHYSEPHLQLSSPAGLIATCAGNAVFSAGQTSLLSAGQDLSANSQHQQSHSVKNGIHLFTQGLASNPHKPNQETGIRLHAAQGKLSQQSQSGHTHLNAAENVHIASTQSSITIAAPKHLQLTAGGAYIRLEGGNIQLHGPATMAFKAGLVELTGPKRSYLKLPRFSHWVLNTPTSFSISLDCYDIFHSIDLNSVEYTAKVNNKILEGNLKSSGKTNRIYTDSAESFEVLIGSSGAWGVVGDDGDYRDNRGEAHHDED